MLRGMDCFRAVFSKLNPVTSEAVPQYIPSARLLINTPVGLIRIGRNIYSLSAPTKFITEAFRIDKSAPLIPFRESLGDLYSQISKNGFMVAASEEEVKIYVDRLYRLQKGVLRLHSRLQPCSLPGFSEAEIDNLLHLERKTKWLSDRLLKVEKWEHYLYQGNSQTPYLIRRKCLNGLLEHAERTLIELGISSTKRLPLITPIINEVPKRNFQLPFWRVVGQISAVFKNAEEVVREEFLLGWKEVKANPIMIGFAILTTVVVVGAVTYWFAERETMKSFYDN